MRSEYFYKAALIKVLLQKKEIGSGDVVLNELTIRGMTRRVDIVAVNGKLHAFEIKTDADSLSRVDGQVKDYLQHFDKVTVVCGASHYEKLKDRLPEHVGLWVLDERSGYSIRVMRRGRTKPVSNPEKLWTFIPRKEIERFLRKNRVRISGREYREVLCKIAKAELDKNKIRAFAISFAKQRYGERWRKFLRKIESKQGNPDPEDIAILLWEKPKQSDADSNNKPSMPQELPSWHEEDKPRPIPVAWAEARIRNRQNLHR